MKTEEAVCFFIHSTQNKRGEICIFDSLHVRSFLPSVFLFSEDVQFFVSFMFCGRTDLKIQRT